MDGGTEQHAVADVVNSEIIDTFTVTRAALNDDLDPLKSNKFMLGDYLLC